MTPDVLKVAHKARAPQRPPLRLATAIAVMFYPIMKFVILRSINRQTKCYPNWVWEMPNRITKSRFAVLPLAILFCYAASSHSVGATIVSFVCIVALLLGDAIDGAWARQIGNTTEWGAKADPYLDKYASASLLAGWLFLIHHFAPAQFGTFAWLVGIRVVQDGVLAFIALCEDRRGLKPRAQAWGKVKAGFDGFAIGFGYAAMIYFANGSSGAYFLGVARGLILTACTLAPLSIWEHARNLRRGTGC